MKSSFTEYVESDYNELEDREPVRRRVLRKGVGILDMEYYDDNEMLMYCPMCKKAGFQVKLGPKILVGDQKPTPDYDQWLQCPSCAEVIAAYVVEGDSSIIKDDIETISNPFENTTEIMGAVSKRHTKAGRRAMDKRRKERDRPHHKDPEIDREMARHGDRVNIIYDSNP